MEFCCVFFQRAGGGGRGVYWIEDGHKTLGRRGMKFKTHHNHRQQSEISPKISLKSAEPIAYILRVSDLFPLACISKSSAGSWRVTRQCRCTKYGSHRIRTRTYTETYIGTWLPVPGNQFAHIPENPDTRSPSENGAAGGSPRVSSGKPASGIQRLEVGATQHSVRPAAMGHNW